MLPLLPTVDVRLFFIGGYDLVVNTCSKSNLTVNFRCVIYLSLTLFPPILSVFFVFRIVFLPQGA